MALRKKRKEALAAQELQDEVLRKEELMAAVPRRPFLSWKSKWGSIKLDSKILRKGTDGREGFTPPVYSSREEEVAVGETFHSL